MGLGEESYLPQLTQAPDTQAGGGVPAMESRLSTLATCWVLGSNLIRGSQPAKLPSFSGYSLENLKSLPAPAHPKYKSHATKGTRPRSATA